jgi:hypothetical protein
MGEVRPEADERRKIPQEGLDVLAASIGNHWVEGYGNLGSVPALIGAEVMGVSVTEMVANTIARMMVLYKQKGPGIWMMAAFWGTAFQIAIMPTSMGPGMGRGPREDCVTSHPGESWISKPSCRRGRNSF